MYDSITGVYVLPLFFNKKYRYCHPERNEGPPSDVANRSFANAQDDTIDSILTLGCVLRSWPVRLVDCKQIAF
jgi:hypothetical protein